jgi:DNA-binding FadR family transcriptional regulator
MVTQFALDEKGRKMKSRRMFWQIVDKIEALIDSGKYPPGSRLPPERELAETFNVSRPTIREAIIALEVRQRVEVKTSSGVYVLENPNAKTEAPLRPSKVCSGRRYLSNPTSASH